MNTQKEELNMMKNIKLDENLQNSDEHIAKVAASLLKDHAQHLDAVTLKRLAEARSLAVSKLEASHGVNQSGNVLQWIGNGFGSYFEQHRLLSVAIVAGAMLLTFFAAQKINADKNLESGDAFLLASELPPEAFADKGFDTWLVSKRD